MARSITLKDAIDEIKKGAYFVECASPSKGTYYLIHSVNGFYRLRTNSGYKIQYDLLKDKLNIAKITFTSGVNAGSADFKPDKKIDRCPWCGIALNENGVCPKCGYKKK